MECEAADVVLQVDGGHLAVLELGAALVEGEAALLQVPLGALDAVGGDGDMALLADEKLDAALLPIGDFYTMGPADAARAAKVIGAKVTVPMHYNTFPPIKQDPKAFAALCEGSSKVVVLAPGESVEL